MKRIAALFVLFFVVSALDAQNTSLKIAGTRLVYPLAQKWIDEYAKLNPAVKIVIAQGVPADSLDVQIVSHALSEDDLKGRQAVALSRYAQLPIVNSQRTDLLQLQLKGFNQNDFKEIYFGHTIPVANFSVYKREKPACASIAFANHFGSQQKDINGTGVKGDDKDLLNAVKRDVNAASYNNLGFIYDIKTRKVTDSIAVIPIDANNNGKIDANENIYDNLDSVIAVAEQIDTSIPVEYVYVLFSKDSKNKEAITNFLKWVITKGQEYNHALGFLKLSEADLKNTSLALGNTSFHCTPKGKLLVQNSLKKGASTNEK